VAGEVRHLGLPHAAVQGRLTRSVEEQVPGPAARDLIEDPGARSLDVDDYRLPVAHR
jgi:hypothetical protein